MTNEVEHLLCAYFDIFISSLVKFLFMSVIGLPKIPCHNKVLQNLRTYYFTQQMYFAEVIKGMDLEMVRLL